MYQIHLYSNGKNTYVNALVRTIDPEMKILKADKAFGRNAEFITPIKDLKNLLSEAKSCTIIIDDRNDVWDINDTRNLIQIFPFVYFNSDISASYDKKAYGCLKPYCNIILIINNIL